MADNVPITAGSGTSIATDDVSGVHYQKVKVDVGGDGVSSPWDGTVAAVAIDSLDDAVSQDPLGCGAVASEDGDPTGVDTDGDLVQVLADLLGRVWVREPVATPHAVDFSASQTGQTIWTPASGKRFLITSIHCSFSAAGAITIWEGSTDNLSGRVAKHNGAANGGFTIACNIVSDAADNVLKYTTGAGAAGSLAVFGYEV